MIDFDYYLNKLQKNTFAIFLFHGVINEATTEVRNYTNKHLIAYDFEQLIRSLKTKGNPVSMDEVLYYKQIGQKLPKYSYAITFDDGFENNFAIAAPILVDYLTPATFYISTHLVNENAMTWIDKIEYCLEETHDVEIFLQGQNKIPIKISDTKSKIEFLDNIRNNVKSNTKDIDINDIIKSVYDQCNLRVIKSNNHPLDKKMTWHQVKKLSKHELFTIGGHSHHHVSLGFLDKDNLINELDTSLLFFKQKAGLTPIHYSYPEGQARDYSLLVIAELKNRGIECCPTAIGGLNNEKTDLFNLNRIFVR